jgi:ssDNA-binding Zn-finger/Zn-ribbon topoisomerase 1
MGNNNKVREISNKELWEILDKPCPCCGKYPNPYSRETILFSTGDFGRGYYCGNCAKKILKVNEICERGAKTEYLVETTLEKWRAFTHCKECGEQLFSRFTNKSEWIKICPNCDIAHLSEFRKEDADKTRIELGNK